MQLRILLLAALVGAALASKGHGVHHLTEADFEEKTGDGKARIHVPFTRPPLIATDRRVLGCPPVPVLRGLSKTFVGRHIAGGWQAAGRQAPPAAAAAAAAALPLRTSRHGALAQGAAKQRDDACCCYAVQVYFIKFYAPW